MRISTGNHDLQNKHGVCSDDYACDLNEVNYFEDQILNKSRSYVLLPRVLLDDTRTGFQNKKQYPLLNQ